MNKIYVISVDPSGYGLGVKLEDGIVEKNKHWSDYEAAKVTIHPSLKPIAGKFIEQETEEGYEMEGAVGWESINKEQYDSYEGLFPYPTRIVLIPAKKEDTGGGDEWEKYIRDAAVKYLELPTHKQVVIWRKLGYDKSFNINETRHDQNQSFLKWVKANDKVKELVEYFNLVPTSPIGPVEKEDEWIEVFGNEPEQYSTIEVKDKYGKIFVGGYYQENGKVCIRMPNASASCMDLEENFTHFRPLPHHTPKKEEGELWEKDLIEDAVNAYYHHANNQLARKDLGDIERRNWEGIQAKCKKFFNHQ